MKLPGIHLGKSAKEGDAWAAFQESRRIAALEQIMVNRASRRAHGLYLPIPKTRALGIALPLPRYIRRRAGILQAPAMTRRVRKQQARILRIAQRMGLA